MVVVFVRTRQSWLWLPLQLVVDVDTMKNVDSEGRRYFPFLSRKSPICGCVFNWQLTPKIAKVLLQSFKATVTFIRLNQTTGRVRGSSLKPVGTLEGTQDVKGLWPFIKHSSLMQ